MKNQPSQLNRKLTIPNGVNACTPLNPDFPNEPDLYFREFLNFSLAKIDSICEQVANKITEALNNTKKPNIIIPLNGGILFLHFLIEKLKIMKVEINKINFIFAFKKESGELTIQENTLTKWNSAIFLIDDIWDTGKSGEEIFNAVLSQIPTIQRLYCYALSTKFSSPKKRSNAILANVSNIVTFPDLWICSGFGMNSGKFKKDPLINALERTSFLPLFASEKAIAKDEIVKYYDLLTQTNLATNSIIPLALFNLIKILEDTQLPVAEKIKKCNLHFFNPIEI